MSNNNNQKKILVVRYQTIGDTLFTLPFFKELRKIEGEECQIDALSNNGNEFILKKIPYVDNVLNTDKIAPMKFKNITKWLPIIKEYNTIYFLCCDKILSVFAFLSGVKKRIGFNLGGCQYNYFLTDRIEYDLNIHAAETYFSLLHPDNPKIENLQLENIFQDIESSDNFNFKDKYITIHPLSSEKLKDWSLDKWKNLIKHIVEKNNYKVVILGSKKDFEKANSLVFSDKVVNICGKTTLEETISVIRHSELLIGVDSGLIHLAAVLEKKSVLLHGSTSLTHWRPLNPNCKIVSKHYSCSPCAFLMNQIHRPTCSNVDCMEAITTEDVINSYEELLNGQ